MAAQARKANEFSANCWPRGCEAKQKKPVMTDDQGSSELPVSAGSWKLRGPKSTPATGTPKSTGWPLWIHRLRGHTVLPRWNAVCSKNTKKTAAFEPPLRPSRFASRTPARAYGVRRPKTRWRIQRFRRSSPRRPSLPSGRSKACLWPQGESQKGRPEVEWKKWCRRDRTSAVI